MKIAKHEKKFKFFLTLCLKNIFERKYCPNISQGTYYTFDCLKIQSVNMASTQKTITNDNEKHSSQKKEFIPKSEILKKKSEMRFLKDGIFGNKRGIWA